MLYGTVHVDLSKKFYSRGNTGIAAINVDKKYHRGMVLSSDMKKKAIQQKTYTPAKLYSICIWKLVSEDIDKIDKIIVCNDAPFGYVRTYLEYLCKDNRPQIQSIFEIREMMHKKIKSLADNKASVYRKRGLKKYQKDGHELNLVRVSLNEIIMYLSELGKLDIEKNR